METVGGEPLYERALTIREKMLGAEHSETASSLSDLGELWRQMGLYAKAEPLQRRALAIKEKTLGMEHPETSTALNNLALLYKTMGDYAKAEPLVPACVGYSREDARSGTSPHGD